MYQLSAVIITHNEERNIARCLASLHDVADEVVVVDSHSTDATQRICEEMGARFLQREWDGYSPQRNFAVDAAANDWILAIDADEELSPHLRESILKVKAENGHRNFKFNRKTNYCGQWINHSGWYPDTKFRLFDRRECGWEGLVHETLTPPKSGIQHLKGDLLHYSYSSIAEHIQRMDRYSTLSALELRDRGAEPSLLRIIISPSLKFFRFYFLQLGILDGVAGIVIASVSAYGTFLKYVKHWYLVKRGVGA
ncbi:MAG: glycosyltransferase family 2 protein [Flavobacteriales bacterium]|nr:glycosyltransferase family 2 protein [Flavobacteriales bacterium]